MKTFKETLHGKLGLAIEAMADGLIKYADHPDFEIEMDVFAGSRKKADRVICIGCLATVAIQQIAHKDIPGWAAYKRNEYLECEPDDYNDFEFAIDSFRTGDSIPLLEYFYGAPHGDTQARFLESGYKLAADVLEKHRTYTFNIQNRNHQRYIPQLRALADDLINQDL